MDEKMPDYTLLLLEATKLKREVEKQQLKWHCGQIKL